MKLKLEEQWVEGLVLLFLVLGFIISVFLLNPYFSYLSIFLSGALAGRIYYVNKSREPILPTVLIIIGFLIGYVAASLWASRILVLFFFALGFILSYYLHMKEILVIFKSENFIK